MALFSKKKKKPITPSERVAADYASFIVEVLDAKKATAGTITTTSTAYVPMGGAGYGGVGSWARSAPAAAPYDSAVNSAMIHKVSPEALLQLVRMAVVLDLTDAIAIRKMLDEVCDALKD